MKNYGLTVILALGCSLSLLAGEYHVAKGGSDNNDGRADLPFLTIQAAANVAQPGDTITVHRGTYRERVNPPRGGSSETRRILYRAAPGERVEIKGSERIPDWELFTGTVWKATVPNTLFGAYNPYKDLISGDWFFDLGREHHTGEVYLNGKSFWEMDILEKVLHPEDSTHTWFCESDEQNTYIYANFHQADPNREEVEINVRSKCFYPDSTGIDYLIVRGFHMSQAATQWAPPTAEQPGLIGTNWSRGWIIEDNVVTNSKCAGITLGKYGDEFDNTSASTASGYIETVKRALDRGWSREEVGSHMVRNNTISDCGQVGICGSLGAVFSTIENNDIHDIWTKRQFDGPETAGIKIHASIDMLIKGNRVVNTGRGIWLDWMAQGARVSGNLCYRNDLQDFYAEVNHGPYLVDNNLFLSLCSVWEMSQGGAYVHNLMAGKLNMSPHERETPYMKPHSTAIAGYQEQKAGDYRFYNNVFLAGCKLNEGQRDPQLETRLQYGREAFGLSAFDHSAFPTIAEGNVYVNGAKPFMHESGGLELEYDPQIRLEERKDGIYLTWTMDRGMVKMKHRPITTELLGKAIVSAQPYTLPDGDPISVEGDYLGKTRNSHNPTVGPFEDPGKGSRSFRVW